MVGGNFVVGLVVFLILVVIQFVVITNGAGRVAEVAARFTLDAMPGKQMAIDADLNAGLITDERGARAAATRSQREADFYGAMDGASKFVKGDAIAGIDHHRRSTSSAASPSAMLQQGMAFGDAVSTYSLLTVGDGLVAQIPALLISTATGIIVTRAATDATRTSARDVAAQLLAPPAARCCIAGRRARRCSAWCRACRSCRSCCSAAILARSRSASAPREQRRGRAAAPRTRRTAARRRCRQPPDAVTKSLSLDPLELEIGYGLIPLVDETQGGELLEAHRAGPQADGVGARPRARSRSASATTSQLALARVRHQDQGVRGRARPARRRLPAGDEPRRRRRVACRASPTVEPAFGLPALWVAQGAREQAEASGYTVVDHASIVDHASHRDVRQHASELLSARTTRTLLDTLKERFPAVVDELVPTSAHVGEVHRVLQLLLRRARLDPRPVTILETLGDRGRLTKDPALLTEYCRQALARQLTQGAIDQFGTLSAVVLEPQLESELGDSVIQTSDGAYLGLDPGRAELIVRAIRDEVESAAQSGHRAAVVCSPKVRRHLRALIAYAMPRTPVLSYNEILPSTHVDAVGTVALAVEGSVA